MSIKEIQKMLQERYSDEEILQDYKQKCESGLWKSEEIVIQRFVQDKNSKILDVGCGAGREAFALLKLGYKNIVCIDISASLVALFNSIAKEKKIKIRASVADIVNFKSRKKFDCVFLLNNVFDQIPLESRRLKALRNCHRVLKRNGTVILTSHSLFYPGKFGEEFLKLLPRFIEFQIKKMFHIPQKELEFGDQFILERKPIFVHLSSPMKIRSLIKKAGFRLVYFNSKKNIEKNKSPTLFTIFDEPLFYVGQKA